MNIYDGLILFENFYEDNRGITRSAGVMECTLQELIMEIENYQFKVSFAFYDRACQEVRVFFKNGSFLYCLADLSVLTGLCQYIHAHGFDVVH